VLNIFIAPIKQLARYRLLKMDVNINYLRETSGLLNLIEWVASLLVLICASASPKSINGGGWVYFTSIACTIVAFALLLINLVRVVEALQTRVNWFLIRLGYVGIFAAFYFISMCISAAGAANVKTGESRSIHSSNTAAAIFAAVLVVTFMWDGINSVKKQREINGPPGPPPTDRLQPTPVGEMRYT